MQPSADPLLDQILQLLADLREHGVEAGTAARVEELLTGGCALALELEGTRRRLRRRALERSAQRRVATPEVRRLFERDLRIAAEGRELRALLALVRERFASGCQAAAQRPR